jgi:hypothetical protein
VGRGGGSGRRGGRLGELGRGGEGLGEWTEG